MLPAGTPNWSANPRLASGMVNGRSLTNREGAEVSESPVGAGIGRNVEFGQVDPELLQGGVFDRIAPFAPFFRVIDVRILLYFVITNRGMPFLS